MVTDSPTEMLEAEHRVIAKVIGAVPVLADQLDAGQAVDVGLLRDIVELMRAFADQCHHGKEELLLFPLLGKKGVPLQGCPVGALTAEHARGRALVKELVDAVDAHQEGEPSVKETVIGASVGHRGAVPKSHLEGRLFALPYDQQGPECGRTATSFWRVSESGRTHRVEPISAARSVRRARGRNHPDERLGAKSTGPSRFIVSRRLKALSPPVEY